MKNQITRSKLFLFSFAIAACLSFTVQAQSSHKVYQATPTTDGSIKIDGVKDEADWKKVKIIDEFVNPWNKEVNAKTELSLLYDSKYLYFFYETIDEDIVLVDDYKGETSIGKEDRVELFFSTDSELSLYYGFEIDPLGRVMDYSAKHYRKFDYKWNLEGIITSGKILDNGYVVEGAIPLSFLREVAGNDCEIYFGAYRGEFSKNEKGETVENWLTIVDPQTPRPDFHVPTSFAKLRFCK